MRKQLFLSIIDRLRKLQKNEQGLYVIAEEPNDDACAIKHFDLWNENLTNTHEDNPFYTPAVFIEFTPIPWQYQGTRVCDSVVTVLLHVVSRAIKPTAHGSMYQHEALEVFDLLDAINMCLDTHHTQGFGPLTNVLSETDTNWEELMHNIEHYTTHITNTGIKTSYQKITQPELKITIK